MNLIKIGDLIINLGEGNLSHADLAAVKQYTEWPNDARRQVGWVGTCLRVVMREAGTSYDADGYAVGGGMAFEFVGEDAARLRLYLERMATDVAMWNKSPDPALGDLYAKPPMPTDYPRRVRQDSDSDSDDIPF